MGATDMAAIRAQEGPQSAFLENAADLVIYGGAAGGGKSYALLLEPLRHVHRPGFSAVIFRRNSTQVRNPGALWDESESLYPLLGATGRKLALQWTFPSGATVQFAHLEHEGTKLAWQGAQVPLIGFDELTHFTRTQFFYMLSRNRSAKAGIRPYVRATCNPVPDDDPVGGWIHEFIGWYIDEDGYAIPERSGVVRWFVNISDTLRWAAGKEELAEQFPTSTPKSFTFIRSSVYDNKILLTSDPGYLANLQALPPVERGRLLDGNWRVRPTAGKVFNRGWFEIVDAAPTGGRTVRGWDLAATEKQVAGDDPDYTAGVKVQRVGDVYYVHDCIEERMGPAAIDRLLLNTAKQDGRACAVRFEMEGGASGMRDSRWIVTHLAGFDAVGVRPKGDKLTRARALAAQAQAGNVKLVRGPWNHRWLAHMHAIPDGAHDDIMDATAIAFNQLLGRPDTFEGYSRQG